MKDEKCTYYNNGGCTKALPGTPCEVQGCVAHLPKGVETIKVKLLHLPLKAKWYDMQESGEKPEEYREITPYWCKRLLGRETALFSYRNNYQSCNVKGFTHVLLRYGYTQRCIVRRIDSISIGRGNPEWGAPTDRDVFIIRHHKEDVVVDGWKIKTEE